jgi:hypothetical protein
VENLEDWVLPLMRDAGLNLENTGEWQSIKRIQDFRREAGHPNVSRGLEKLTSQEFSKLVRDATSAMSKLARLDTPKTPPPMFVDLAGGTM